MRTSTIACLLVLPPVLALTGCAGDEIEVESVPVVSVGVTEAQTMPLAVRVQAPATVYPREEARVASRLTAPIRELRAAKGDQVRAGQILAQLDDRDLVAQRAEAEAMLAETQASLEKVSRGTLPADIERAEAQVRAAEAARALAQSNYDRRSRLYEQGAIPERDLMASQTELAQASANAEVAATELRLLEEQSGTRDVEIATSRRDQARSRRDLLYAQLEFAQIRSPFDGAITEQFLFPGDMARPDTPLFTIADLSRAIARAQVPEGDATAIAVGQICTLVPTDMPAAVFEGRVTVVNAAIDVRRRTVEVWCEIPNAGARLRAGVFGTVSITTDTQPGAVVVPVAAVQLDEGTANGFVMIATADGVAQRQPVVTGPVIDGMVAIRSGLEGGEMVIVEGGYGLPEGSRVEWSPDSP